METVFANRQMAGMGIVDQIEIAVKPSNRTATLAGAVIGGFVPIASYVIAHYETQANPIMWLLVGAGLAYSASTVYGWAKVAFKNPIKALGFVTLLEGVMTFAHTPALSYSALAILVCINAIATGANLVADRREKKSKKRERTK